METPHDPNPSSGPDGRRQFLRVAAAVPIRFRVAPAIAYTSSLTIDVGGGGVCLWVSEPLPLGAEVDAELALPTGPIRFSGSVAWCDSIARGARGRAGIEILFINERDHQLLTRFCLTPVRSDPR
jgi:hypothetical protein